MDEEEAEETQRELDELGLGDIEGARLLSPASVNEIASAIGPGKINKKGKGKQLEIVRICHEVTRALVRTRTILISKPDPDPGSWNIPTCQWGCRSKDIMSGSG